MPMAATPAVNSTHLYSCTFTEKQELPEQIKVSCLFESILVLVQESQLNFSQVRGRLWDVNVTNTDGFTDGLGRLEPQLIGGNTACSGRVEIRHGDTWTTVCDSHLDLQAASVICNELDCGTVVSTPGGARFSEGYGSIWSEKIHCLGNESHLVYCPRTLHPNETCSHSSDASIVCSGKDSK